MAEFDDDDNNYNNENNLISEVKNKTKKKKNVNNQSINIYFDIQWNKTDKKDFFFWFLNWCFQSLKQILTEIKNWI